MKEYGYLEESFRMTSTATRVACRIADYDVRAAQDLLELYPELVAVLVETLHKDGLSIYLVEGQPRLAKPTPMWVSEDGAEKLPTIWGVYHPTGEDR